LDNFSTLLCIKDYMVARGDVCRVSRSIKSQETSSPTLEEAMYQIYKNVSVRHSEIVRWFSYAGFLEENTAKYKSNE